MAVACWSVMIVITTVAFLVLWCVYCIAPFKANSNVRSSFPPLWPFLAVYVIWARFFDASPEHGGRMSPWFRSWRFWKYFADYYPAS